VIQGWVSAGEPVSGAELAIENLKGKRIYDSKTAVTGDLGSFIVAVDKLPADFRISASGGSQAGQELNVDLTADYRGFDPQAKMVYINAVTTLVSRYIDAKPDVSLEQATRTVKRFLEIPEKVDIGRGLHVSNGYFSHQGFIEAAVQSGGVAALLDQLLTEMSASATATHPFPAEAANTNLLGGGQNLLGDSAGSFIAKGLANGALSYIGGNVLGWGLSQFGLGFGDQTAEELQKIEQQLQQMQQEIEQMQQQLVQISQQLDRLQAKMQQMENELSTQIKQTDYDVRVGQLTQLITNIVQIRERLTNFVSNPPADIDVLNYTRSDIIKRIESQLLGNEDVIHYQLTGVATATPLLKLWSQVVKGKHRFLSAADYDLVKSQFDYFDTIQLWLAEILVEYYHAQAMAEPEGSAKRDMFNGNAQTAIESYNQHLAAQTELLLPAIPEGVIWDRDQDLLINPQPYDSTWFELLNMFMKFGAPPEVVADRPFPGWRSAGRAQVLSMFNQSGGNPYNYVTSQGWPSSSLNPNMVIGVGYPDSQTNTKVEVFSLSDGTTRIVDQGSSEKFYWVLVVEPWITDPKTQDDTLVKFFW
jgi:hypothetical protein